MLGFIFKILFLLFKIWSGQVLKGKSGGGGLGWAGMGGGGLGLKDWVS